MKSIFFILTIVLIAIVNSNDIKKVDSDSFIIGYKFGTIGAGVDFSYLANKKLSIRLSTNAYSQFRSLRIEDKDFKTYGLLLNNALLADLHPWENSFYFSWGAFFSKSKLNLIHKPKTGTVKIGSHKYPSMQIGKVTTDIFLDHKINPYIGFGYNSMNKKDKWGFIFDIGVIYIGTPKAEIKAYASEGFKALQPILNKEAKIEEKDLNKKIKKYKIFPVLSVGIGYRF